MYFSDESRMCPVFISIRMNKFEKECIKLRILKLASLKCTGPPADLAVKFEISERSVKRLVRELREEGRNLRFDYASISYVLKEV